MLNPNIFCVWRQILILKILVSKLSSSELSQLLNDRILNKMNYDKFTYPYVVEVTLTVNMSNNSQIKKTKSYALWSIIIIYHHPYFPLVYLYKTVLMLLCVNYLQFDSDFFECVCEFQSIVNIYVFLVVCVVCSHIYISKFGPM